MALIFHETFPFTGDNALRKLKSWNSGTMACNACAVGSKKSLVRGSAAMGCDACDGAAWPRRLCKCVSPQSHTTSGGPPIFCALRTPEHTKSDGQASP